MQTRGWLDRAASVAPGRIAVQTPTESCTYAQLLALSRSGAARLQELGVVRGDRVALALPAGLGFVQALHACLLMGAVAVPVDLRLAPEERARIAESSVLTVEEALPPTGGERIAPAQHDLHAAALVVHTSGTTAAPRPVELSFGNVLWSALGSGVALGVDPEERWLCTLPLSHVGGLSILLRSAIYATTAVVHERFETDRALRALQQERITLVSVVATTLVRLLDAGLHEPQALRCALAGGGPVPAALRARALDQGVPVSLTYGLTETCSQVSTLPVAAIEDPAHTAGPPLFCTQLELAEDGEILISGPTVARSATLRDGMLATGDLGCLDERGWLQVVGRKADTIVTGGENVAPAEVEAVLEAYPAIVEAGVVGRPHEEWGEMVAAWVVAESGRSIDWDDLVEHCRRHLASYKVPKQFDRTAEPLPRTASGKLLRRELA